MELSDKKLFIVTADQIVLIDQLSSEIRKELKQTPSFVINWNQLRNKTMSDFLHHIRRATERNFPTILVITSQSLKLRLAELLSNGNEVYESLVNNLNSIYIDEAHHLRAEQTESALLGLIEESHKAGNKEVLLYGTTATPVHHEKELRALFEREHWSYLNEAPEEFFNTHSLESILTQLSRAINQGDITPFDDLYVLGEDSFLNRVRASQDHTEESIFINSEESTFYELNPRYYNTLAEFLFPIFQDNKKGFIVTATISEAERLTKFLNQYFKRVSNIPEIEFDAYHSKMTRQERKTVLDRSTNTENSHYIVAVRALDEGVNLPHLSSYIDLNVNVPIKKMMHRMGRVLRLYPGKMTSDIVFLINYKNQEMVEDLLSVMEEAEKVSFRGGAEKKERRELSSPEAVNVLSREDLIKIREELQDSIKSFWNLKDGGFLTLRGLIEAVREYNLNTSPEEQITTLLSYSKHYKKIPGAPAKPGTFYGEEWEKIGKWLGFLGKTPLIETILELQKAVREYNSNAPPEEQITTLLSYSKHYKKIPGAPSAPNQTYGEKWIKIGRWPGFLGKTPLIETILELQKAVREYNSNAPLEEQITTQFSYKEHYKKIPDAPSSPDKFYGEEWEKIGKWLGFFGKSKPTFFETISELQQAVREYNSKAPPDEQITTVFSYSKHYKKILGAPAHPNQTYGEKWIKIGKWPGFFEKTPFIETILELQKEVREYNSNTPPEEQITSQPSYKKHHKKIPGAPSNPDRFYREEWIKIGKWLGFFEKTPFIETILELQKEVREYNSNTPPEEQITNQPSYRKHYKKIPGAPSSPDKFYGEEWEKIGKWRGFIAGVLETSCENTMKK